MSSPLGAFANALITQALGKAYDARNRAYGAVRDVAAAGGTTPAEVLGDVKGRASALVPQWVRDGIRGSGAGDEERSRAAAEGAVRPAPRALPGGAAGAPFGTRGLGELRGHLHGTVPQWFPIEDSRTEDSRWLGGWRVDPFPHPEGRSLYIFGPRPGSDQVHGAVDGRIDAIYLEHGHEGRTPSPYRGTGPRDGWTLFGAGAGHDAGRSTRASSGGRHLPGVAPPAGESSRKSDSTFGVTARAEASISVKFPDQIVDAAARWLRPRGPRG